MPPPSLIKTWNHSTVVIPAQASIVLTHKHTLFALKELFVSFGWTVSRSCDSVNNPVDGDSWVDYSSVRWGTDSVNYASSWVILDHPISGQLFFRSCMSGNNGYDAVTHMGLAKWSQSGTFTGGTRMGSPANNPSAPDERNLIFTGTSAPTNFLTYTTNVQRILIGMKSSDSRSFRIFQLANNNVYTAFIFECLDNQHSTFVNRSIAHGEGGTNFLTYANFHRATTRLVANNSLGDSLSVCLSCENILGVGLGETWNVPDVDGEIPMLTVRAWSDSPTDKRYWLGDVPDLWFGPTGYTNVGDTYSDAQGNIRKFIQLNHMIFPWDGSEPIAA